MGFKKGRNRDNICSNKLENYRFEIFNMVGSAIRNFYIYLFLYIYFYDSGIVRIFLGVSVMLLYLIETRLLFNEMSKAIVESNIDNREKDVKHILEKRKFRIQLGIICFGIIAFIALLVGIMPD